MNAKFFGGPYDGLELDHHQINACCDIGSHPSEGGGLRSFLLLPSPKKWDDLVAGRISKANKDSWGGIYMYERKRTASGVEYHVATDSD
jgi:hypothetical protein